MCPLLETIKFKNNQFYNLSYHTRRMNAARKSLFNCSDIIDLENILMKNNEDLKPDKTYKCRIIYKKKILKIEYREYNIKKIQSLKILFDNKIEYGFKYENREKLNQLRKKRGPCDDILIIKNGLITDTSYSNILFFEGTKWITPADPLLKGTKRAKLLYEGQMIEAKIRLDDLKKYKKARLINSMIDFEDKIDISMDNIII